MRGLTSMLHERRASKNSATTTTPTNNNANNDSSSTPRLGVRRTSSGVRQRTTAQALHHSSSHSNLNNSSSNIICTASTPTTTPTTTHPHRSKLLEALAHPAQAAAAAAAVSGHRGRKRKTCSLILLTVACLGVVHYAGTMYDHDPALAEQGGLLLEGGPSKRRARLRSRSPSRLAENSRDTTANNDKGGLAAWVSHHYSQKNQRSQEQTSKDSAAKSAISHHHQQQQQQQQQLRTPQDKVSNKSQRLEMRIQNALKAAFVADAASMGTHWMYNPDDLKIVLQNPPEFHNPPLPKFYSSQEYPGHYHHGQSSPYGEQLWFVTNYVQQNIHMASSSTVENEDKDDDDSDASDPGSLMEPMSRAMQQWAETFGGRADQATLEFLSCRRQRLSAEMETHAADDDNDDGESAAYNNNNNNGACGADDSQAHFFVKVIPMTCLLVGHPHRRQYVEQAIRVHQNHDQAVLFGLALSDLLERVLLMDTDADMSAAETYDNPYLNRQAQTTPPKSLQQALDATLRSLEQEHTDGWLHFALSLTEHHRQHDALVEAWTQARDNADIPMEQLAGQVGRSCHMPGALVLALQGLYRAAAQFDSNSPASSTTKSPTSSLTHLHRGYDYYVHALLGIPHHTDAPQENTALVDGIRDNIRAAGDTCSRSIYLGAVLGAAYGPPPMKWWNQVDSDLAERVSQAASVIAEAATKRLESQQ